MLAVTGVERAHFLEGLLELGRAGDPVVRRALFRHSIAALGQAASHRGPAPLEGIEASALVPAMRAALADGLLENLDWLSPDAAVVALYEIAAALPQGPEKREVGRRVATYTYEGTADTFAAVAARMARASSKALSGSALGARVALALELPPAASARTSELAFALASRRELAQEWIARPARGSLPARRLSARLMERAAARAAQLAAQGEDDAARPFRAEALTRCHRELLWDREPLVWKHAATARGLLAGIMPEWAEEVEAHLSLRLSPTEWRRAATSLAASAAIEPASAARRIGDWCQSGILERDRDVAGCFLWGLAHAALFEPEAAEEILFTICQREGAAVGEAFALAASDQRSWSELESAQLVRRHLGQQILSEGGRHASCAAVTASQVLEDLERGKRSPPSVRMAVDEALLAFASHGPKRAHELALSAARLAAGSVSALEALPRGSAEEAPTKLALLRDLDIGLLQSATLSNLLALGRRAAEGNPFPAQSLEDVRDRLGHLCLREEAAELPSGERQPSLSLHRMKALIHVLDAEVDADGETSRHTPGPAASGTRPGAIRDLWLSASHTLAKRLASLTPAEQPRAVGAALARGLEGLVRVEVCDAIDVLLFAACRLREQAHVSILAEACRQPELGALFGHYAVFLGSVHGHDDTDELRRRRAALERFANDLSHENSSREDSLRSVLVALARALEAIHGASSLADLTAAGAGKESALGTLSAAASSLIQMVAASSQRMAIPENDEGPGSMQNPTSGLMRAARRVAAGIESPLPQAIDELLSRIGPSLPSPISALVASTLAWARKLPASNPRLSTRALDDWTLPSWLPARRTIGGFYVEKPLGTGGSGSVFVVKRSDERDDPHAEAFALKVPAYSAQIARHMSEPAFLQGFQNEASALLSLPVHPNLARFVTFDRGARPKPILVMELVEGISADLMITRRKLTMARALALLDGVFAGLEAMHAVGIAHLDVKPANVVLRDGVDPVLVDFGLAGRHLRPGCGSAPYGAPEVWGVAVEGEPAPATLADVYSAACLVYETLTTQPLFDQSTEVALITAHVAHDGWPTPLRSWHRQKGTAELAELCGRGLRRRPRDRIDISSFRKRLASLGSSLSEQSWPLSP